MYINICTYIHSYADARIWTRVERISLSHPLPPQSLAPSLALNLLPLPYHSLCPYIPLCLFLDASFKDGDSFRMRNAMQHCQHTTTHCNTRQHTATHLRRFLAAHHQFAKLQFTIPHPHPPPPQKTSPESAKKKIITLHHTAPHRITHECVLTHHVTP